MSKTAAQLTPLVEPILGAGEHLLAAVKVNYNGTVQPNQAAISGGLTGLLHAEQSPPPVDPDATVRFPAVAQMALGLTDRRLLVFGLGLTGKPRQFVGEVPLRAVAEVDAGEVAFGRIVRLVLRSTAVVDVEVLRGEDAEPFIAALHRSVGGSSDLPPA
ncbi:MAG: hypothetical protein MUF83_09000 [Acidimicrobiales bacterium]|nr:hypothetical protein [Acidimicrobiales bacterium]